MKKTSVPWTPAITCCSRRDQCERCLSSNHTLKTDMRAILDTQCVTFGVSREAASTEIDKQDDVKHHRHRIMRDEYDDVRPQQPPEPDGNPEDTAVS